MNILLETVREEESLASKLFSVKPTFVLEYSVLFYVFYSLSLSLSLSLTDFDSSLPSRELQLAVSAAFRAHSFFILFFLTFVFIIFIVGKRKVMRIMMKKMSEGERDWLLGLLQTK